MKDTALTNAIEIVLQRAFPTAKIHDFSVKAGSANGDNYLGVMYAITAELEDKNSNRDPKIEHRHLVLKTSSTNESRKELSENFEIFDREAAVYTQLIPELMKFQKTSESEKIVQPAFVTCFDASTAGSEDNKTCDGTPMCRHCQPPLPWDYILMEDIREVGAYKMANRFTGLDFDHCQLVMSELGKYHALGYAYMKSLKSKASLFEKFPFLKESFFTTGNVKTIEDIYKAPMKSVLSVLAKTYHVDSLEYTKIQKLVSGILPISCHFVAGSSDLSLDEMLTKPANISDVNMKNREQKERNQWLVLAHGDCWVNNFLFQYCGDKPTAVKLIDLQVVREICLTSDLSYFFYMSTTAELRKAHLDTLLDTYLNAFKNACKTLKVEPWLDFTLENLKQKFRKTMLFGMSTGLCLMPLILLPKDAAADLDKEATKENAFGSSFTNGIERNVELEKRLVSMAKEALDNGLFD